MADLSLRIADLSPEKRELLLERLSQKRAATARPPIAPQPRETNVFPLSFAQQRLWFLDQVDPGTPVYNIPAAVRLAGPLDTAVIERSLNEIVRRHDCLRTTFATIDSKPVQIIAPALTVPLPVVPLPAHLASTRDAEVERLIAEEAQRPFDLTRGPLLRATLLRLDAGTHILLLTMHHIISDGWSMSVFIKELQALYTAFVAQQPAPLPELPIQYADYAVWQADWLQGAVLETQRAYWRAQLAGAPPMLDLPIDRPRPPVRTFRGARHTLLIPRPLSEALVALSRQEEATLFMTLLAAFKILLQRYSGQDDIVVGTPIAGRTRAETKDLIGCFLNTLVLRSDLSGNPSFRELLGRVREVCLGAYAHQDLPFEKLLEELQPERNLSHTPLFQVFFNMINVPGARMELPGLTLEVLAPPEIGSKFDLTLYVEEKEAQVQIDLVYNADLFGAARMEELLDQLHLLLSQIAANPAEPIERFTLVTARAAACLPDPAGALHPAWTGAAHAAFSRQAQACPAELALVDPQESWTYAELEERSNRLANYLVAQGIRPQHVVAIYSHRSAALVWALLGVLKAGAAFLILDPAYPDARLIDYIELARPHGWIRLEAAGPLSGALEESVESLVCCCRLTLPRRACAEWQAFLADYSAADPHRGGGPDDLAYVTFTSGSTGRPKGIMGTHRPLSHFLEWHSQTFGLTRSDRFSVLSGLAHDPLLRDIFTPLWLGATVCIPDPEAIRSPGYLAEWMRQARISVAHLTPPLGLLLSEATPELASAGKPATLPSLRYVFFGGDVLTQHDVARLRRIAPAATCVNFYGTTETPQAMSYFVVPDLRHETQAGDPAEGASQAIVPLGRGIADVQLLVLNAAGQRAGIGELGEIHVRTPYLSMGYLGDEALTVERFIPDPFAKPGARDLGLGTWEGELAAKPLAPSPKSHGARLYRTGDLGRYLPDGNVAFHSRADQQVKIRGFRIELGEVESVLSQHAAVREAVAVAREEVPGDKRLVAYVVPATDEETRSQGDKETRRQGDKESGDADDAQSSAPPSSFILHPSSLGVELRAFLQARLPSYMVPAAFVLLEALPLTPNGKVDRKALPRPEGLRSKAAYAVPQTEMERAIAAVWQEVLHVEMVGVDDNFFDLGGSSVHTVQVQNRLRETLQRDIPIIELFKYPTVGSLAKSLNEQRREPPSFQDINDRVKKQNAALERQKRLRSRL